MKERIKDYIKKVNWKAKFIWLLISFMTYLTALSVGLNIYQHFEKEQMTHSVNHMQEKLIKHINKFGEIEDD